MSVTTTAFSDFIADALTSYIASEPDLADFIMRRPDGSIIYIDPEEGEVHLIVVYPAEVIANEGKA